jgi:hypothetical protein
VLQVQRYALAPLTTDFAGDLRDAALLAARAGTDGEDLRAMIAELEHLRARLRFLEAQIAYHRFWQRAIPASPAYFAARAALAADAERLAALRKAGDNVAPREVEVLRRRLRDGVAPFVKTADLAIATDADGVRRLEVRLATDIADESFLRAFADGVEREWSQCEAARRKRFRIDLAIERIEVNALYPDEKPPVGAVVDAEKHLARFPAGRLVLTTGGASTHALLGRAIVLGADPTSPRVLAHEFGHLLGFQDAYLRAADGPPDPRFGLVIAEWTGVLDDLMGSPGHGTVGDDLVETLLAHYGG